MSSTFEIACTGCSFCSDRCPMNIPIPEYFAIYNEAESAANAFDRATAMEKYETLSKDRNKASDCIRCGQCEGFCTEHLPIIGFLQDIAEEFEDY